MFIYHRIFSKQKISLSDGRGISKQTIMDNINFVFCSHVLNHKTLTNYVSEILKTVGRKTPNKRTNPSLQLQVIVDHMLLITDSVVGWLRCTHGARSFRNSAISTMSWKKDLNPNFFIINKLIFLGGGGGGSFWGFF